MIQFNNKKVLVCGFGRTGKSVTNLLLNEGASVHITVNKLSDEDKQFVDTFKSKGIVFHITDSPNDIVTGYDYVVISPGIDTNSPFVITAIKNNVSVISEIEVAYNVCKGKMIAITGTNGKTTVTTLTNKIINEYTNNSFAVGNIGIPFSEFALKSDDDTIFVTELSSYQLETTYSIKPKVSAVLNITEDHLARHKTMENYIETKQRIFKNQTADDFLVLNYDDEITRNMKDKSNAKCIMFSRKSDLSSLDDCYSVFVKGDKIVTNFTGELLEILSLSDIKICGDHNIENVLASIANVLPFGVPFSNIKQSICTFYGVEHRIEFVREIDGIKIYNDSKATNPDSAINAVKSLEAPLILIVGGEDKGIDMTNFVHDALNKVSHFVIIGAGTPNFVNACKVNNVTDYTCCDGLSEAVKTSFSLAQKGDTILLSPACASFDMFKDFEKRGEFFKEEVHKL